MGGNPRGTVVATRCSAEQDDRRLCQAALDAEDAGHVYLAGLGHYRPSRQRPDAIT